MRVEVITISWLWKRWAKEQGEERSLGQVIRLRRPVKDSVPFRGCCRDFCGRGLDKSSEKLVNTFG